MHLMQQMLLAFAGHLGTCSQQENRKASPELVSAEEAWGSGSTPTDQRGGEFGKFRSMVDSQNLLTFQKNDQLRQPGKSESHRQCQPEIFEGPCQHPTVMLIRGELSRSKPTRGQIGEVKRLQYRHLYIGRSFGQNLSK